MLNKTLKNWLVEILVVIAFMVSFTEHIAVAMYFLAGVVFYFYIPQLYAYSRVNIFHHIRNKEFIHLKYYPLEFFFWLIGTCFFAFILAHLLADLSYGVDKHIHYVIYLVLFLDLGFIWHRELSAKNLNHHAAFENYETQGRLLSFEILFIFLLLFMFHLE